MARFTKPLAALLATSFTAPIVHGLSDCVTSSNFRCKAGTGPMNLSGCEITDDDVSNLRACLDTRGRAGITSLDLGENLLTTVPAGLFVDMSSLYFLDLKDNAIQTFEPGAFEGLHALGNLQLGDNGLETLPANVFDGLTGLNELNLQRNILSVLDDAIFADLVALTNLHLDSNDLVTLPTNLFAGMTMLTELDLRLNSIGVLEVGIFADLVALTMLELDDNSLESIPSNLFANLGALEDMYMDRNNIMTIETDSFAGLGALTVIYLGQNSIATIAPGAFTDMVALENLNLDQNMLEDIPADIFTGLVSLEDLGLSENSIRSIDVDAFVALGALEDLDLGNNLLETLPENVFAGMTILQSLDVDGNPELQCVPTNAAGTISSTVGASCGCTPADVVSCGADEVCAAGTVGYTCVVACTEDSDCNTDGGEVCCPLTNVCEDPNNTDAGACGDPHMTGFRGQKFDFTGKDSGWYAVVSDLPHMHLNMRVTSPVPSVPEITYITGISIITTDVDGLDHTIVISVADPHNLDSSCPVGVSPCLADGALHVVVNGEEVIISPGEVSVAPGISIAAVNLPGACRSFGFETYWQRKKLERLAQPGRKLVSTATMQDMSDWILSDPTATNIVECEEYVESVTAADVNGLFAHQSEHASFQIMTPAATIRLSHGKLHQLPLRDPTDQFDLPDHLAWQMNMAIDHSNMGLDTTGILGETLVPTVDDNGNAIMQGMDAIRGQQEDYRVEGPLGVVFAQDQHRE